MNHLLSKLAQHWFEHCPLFLKFSMCYDWNRNFQEYKMFQGVLVGLQEQIMQAVDEQYVHALKDNLVGYAWVTPLAMLDYLFSKCVIGLLDVDKLKLEKNELQSNNDHILKSLWKQNNMTEKRHQQELMLMIHKWLSICHANGSFGSFWLTRHDGLGGKGIGRQNLQECQVILPRNVQGEDHVPKAIATNMGYINKMIEMQNQFSYVLAKILWHKRWTMKA